MGVGGNDDDPLTFLQAKSVERCNLINNPFGFTPMNKV